VGKESIIGVMAAMTAWKTRDHEGIRARERSALDLWSEALANTPGVTATVVPDPTKNPLDRMKVSIDPQAAHISAWDLAIRLASGDHPIIVRDHEVEHGHFFLDPCNLHPGQEFIVAQRLSEELGKAALANDVIETPIEDIWLDREAKILQWPD
ncbi:MAG: hypothetical protein ACOH2M_06225, partial [Cypionkella sp.]